MEQSAFGAIVPHPPIMVEAVGGSRAHVTEASRRALEAVASAIDRYDPDTLVLMSPHAPAVADAVAIDDAERYEGSLAQFGDARRQVSPGDRELARMLADELEGAGTPAILRGETPALRSGWLDHASLVPLAFLDPRGLRRLVVISLSDLPYGRHRAIGEAVRRAAERLGRRIVFLASGDLSHRLTPDAPAGYSEHAFDLDAAIVTRVRAGVLSELAEIDAGLVAEGGECGMRSFIALGGLTGDDPVPTHVLAYEGPWGVGYLTALVGDAAIAAFSAARPETPAAGHKGGMAGEDESPVVSLARGAIERWVREREEAVPVALDAPDLPVRAGAFVSLHRNGQLRGCIGTVLPTRDTLAEEVASIAVEAAVRDPRFPPLSEAELDDLDVKVDVLYPPEACTLADLDPASYGVIVSSGWRRGLLLPDLEGVDEVTEQIEIAMRKAGIQRGEPCSYERFRVDRYT